MSAQARKDESSVAQADPQQERVYEWETEFADWNRKTITLKEVRDYVRTACAYYDLKAPPVRSHKGAAMAYSMDDGSYISFSAPYQNPAIALHEAAHFIADRLCPRAAAHGPTWLGIYLWLLIKAGTASEAALRASLRKHKCRWRHLPPTIFSCRH